jgi:hypothetical protein
VLPRREAALIRKPKAPISIYRGQHQRERVLGDIRYSTVRQFVI